MSRLIWILVALPILGLAGFGWASATSIRAEEGISVEWEASRYFVDGENLRVTLHIEVTGEKSVQLENWALSSAAFSVNGHALGSRKGKKELSLEAGQVVKTSLNLASSVHALEAWDRREFRLTYHGISGTEPQEILFFEVAEKGIEFMELPTKQLVDYQVILRTNQGDMWCEFWPDVAEQHTRNYLDLSYTGFYEGTRFHRVIPGFMIQGGQAKPGGKAPRKLLSEFTDRKHVRGVLSAARLPGQPNSATSEFFVMHSRYPSLDGQYSAFGQLIEGLEVVDRIVNTGSRAFAPNDKRGHVPTSPQIIERAIVVKSVAPPKKEETPKKD